MKSVDKIRLMACVESPFASNPVGRNRALDLDLIQVIDDPQAVVNSIFDYYRSRTFEPSAEEKERMLSL